VKRAEPVVDAPAVAQGSLFADKDVLLLFIASMLMWTCNTMYIIDMPLYITANLGLPERLAGLLMGTAAGLEIPIMLLAGYSVRRFGKRKIMLFAVLAGVLFYTGLVLFKFKTALMLLQIFNAIFIGIVAGIGMLYFQDLMPGRAGAATTLFTNSISTGVILAGVLQGVLTETWGHNSVYVMAMILAILSLIICARVREA
ncbi:MFS transporter, partial [Yersinia enterocolitica]|nr:MFS transporter [Yersinia enterocolitica]